jgi:hypothetical protein
MYSPTAMRSLSALIRSRYHDVVAGMVARLPGRLRMDRIPRSSRTLVPGADRSERKSKASHGKLARARVVVQVAAPSWCCGPFLEARRISLWNCLGRICAVCLRLSGASQ